MLETLIYESPWIAYAVLLVVGVGAGIINTVAGGGSVLTLPALIFVGLPADVANATNRIGLIAQNVTGIQQFHYHKVWERHLSWRLMIVAAVGAVLGAWFAAYLPEENFRTVLGVLMLGLLVLLLKQPKPHLVEEGAAPEDAWGPLSPRGRVGLLAVFFGLGIYAGFIQAGMGIMVVIALGWFLRMDLVRANFIKLVVILGLSVIALGTFMAAGVAIAWFAGFAAAGGQMIGAVIGSWVAVKKGEAWIKAIMTVAILLASGKLLNVDVWLRGLLGW